MTRIVRWMTRGALATVAMGIVIVAGHVVLQGTLPPPAVVLSSAQKRLGIEARRSRTAWLIPHFLYGTFAAPLGYALLRRRLPKDPTAAGLIYSELDWAVDYLALWPLLKLYPWPQDEPAARAALNVVSHAVYGVVLGQTERLFD